MPEKKPKGVGDRRPVPSPPGHKWCPRCEEHKKFEDFYPRKRNEDGSIKSYAGYCKKCSNVGAAKAAFEAHRDPVRGPKRRENHRLNERIYREQRGVASRGVPYKLKGLKEGYRRDRMLVDPKPFIDWFERHIKLKDTSLTAFAKEVGEDESLFRRMQKGEHEQIDIAAVDRILINSGTDTQLWELYDLD